MNCKKIGKQLIPALRPAYKHKIIAESHSVFWRLNPIIPFFTYLKYCLILAFIITPHLVSAQKQGQPLIDSLLTELISSPDDTNKVKLLDNLSLNYVNINHDEGIRIAQEALDLSTKIHWQKGINLAMVDLGLGHEAKSEHAKALDYYQKALAGYERSDDKANVSKVLIYTAFVYLAQSKYFSALSCDFEALKINEDLGDRKKSAIVMNNIGSIYSEQKEYAKAAEYYAYALRIDNDLGDQERIARDLNNSGILFGVQGNYAEAVKQYLKALKINEALGKTNYIEVTLGNIGDAYSQLKQYKNALVYEVQALKMSEKMGNKDLTAINMGNIGETYLRMAKDAVGPSKPAYLHRAVQYLANAVTMCTKTNHPGPLMEFSRYLSEAYFLSGNYKKAFESLNQYTVTKDSVFSLQNSTRITALEQDREDELRNKEGVIKDKQIQINNLTLSKNQYKQKLYVTGIVLLLLVIGVVLKNLYTYRKSNSVLKKELKKESDENILTNEKLQESEEHYKSLFNLNPSPMWVLDSESFRFLQVNEAAIKNYGYTNEEFLSMTAKDIKMEDDMEEFENDLKKNVQQGTPLSIFTRHRRKNKEEFYVEVIFNRIPFKGRSGILTIAEDISIQVDYIKAIEIQNDKLREIAWIQSHKVRSPLSTILGLVELLNYDLPDVEVKEVIQGILISAQKLDNVIRETTENTTTYDLSHAYPVHVKKLFPDNFNIEDRSS
jgi:PAS domain S-box-containing protein